jgi:hypothetical protein
MKMRLSALGVLFVLAGCGGGGGDGGTTGPGPVAEPVTVAIDASADRHPISPDIYGVTLWYRYNWVADTTARDLAFARDVRLPVNRHGGNATSRYNWLLDSSNAAADWYFMGGNGQSSPTPGLMVDTIVENNRANGVKTVVTVPTGPYINNQSETHCSYPVSIYGEQEAVNPYDHPGGDSCGNGKTKDGKYILLLDPLRDHIENTPEFQRQWIRHLVRRFGSARSGGIAVYELDNEPSLWMETHHDVHPQPLGYHELRDRSVAYAEAIKSADPAALVLGPSDVVWENCWKCTTDGPSDNGGVPMGKWFLEQMAAAERASGRRLLDYFSEHYPGEQTASPVTRAVDNIRKWKQWIAESYPGTMLAIDEYSWSDPKGFREGLLVAEGLGAFGHEGVALASYWPSPDWNDDATTPGAMAFRLYRNCDGAGGGFGETSVRAASSNEGRLAVFAAERLADRALTVVAVNKSTGEVPARFSFAGIPPAGRAVLFQLSEANPRAIVRAGEVTVSGGAMSLTLPVSSATMIVVGGT